MDAKATKQAQVVNGVNVGALFDTIDAIKAQPPIAKFQFRIGNRWCGGGHNRSCIDGFTGACAEQRRTTPFVLDNDEPPVLLGGDRAPIRSSTSCTRWPAV